MTIDSFLNFLFKHNTTVIEVLIAVVLIMLVLLALRLFMSSKEPSSSISNSSSLGDLENSLKKILEQAGKVPTTDQISPAVASANPEASNLVQEITKLKEELTVKQKQVDELKNNSAQSTAVAAPGVSTEDKDKLDAKIKELQAKLSEYEIISEDIADLSFYKEQNAKLAREVEALKAGGATAVASAAPAAAGDLDIVGKAKATVDAVLSGKETSVAAATTEVAKAAPAPTTTEAPATTAEAPASAAAAPAAPAEPAVNNVVDDNLMAEFDAAVEEQKENNPEDAKAEVNLGDMDMDKMMAEAATITTATGPEISAEEALGSGLDENKLLAEASELEKVSTEDKKLMGDFENFVKKGS